MAFRILMVCTGNICRSPMAEGLLRHLLPPSLATDITVQSAGTHGLHGNRAESFAVNAAAEYGADISDHRARVLSPSMVRSADLVLAMEKYHLNRINEFLFFGCRYAWLMGSFDPQRVDPEIEDPYGSPLGTYARCAAEIMACIPGVIDHIRKMVDKKAS